MAWQRQACTYTAVSILTQVTLSRPNGDDGGKSDQTFYPSSNQSFSNDAAGAMTILDSNSRETTEHASPHSLLIMQHYSAG
jgi:hypothetical protein